MSYDPTIGRWTQEDPIAFEGGDANLYRYVGNSPTNHTDPTGLQTGMYQYYNKEGKVVWVEDNPEFSAGFHRSFVPSLVGTAAVTGVGGLCSLGMAPAAAPALQFAEGGTLIFQGSNIGKAMIQGRSVIVTIDMLDRCMLALVNALRQRGFQQIIIRTGAVTPKVKTALDGCVKNGWRFPMGPEGGVVTPLKNWPYYIIEFTR